MGPERPHEFVLSATRADPQCALDATGVQCEWLTAELFEKAVSQEKSEIPFMGFWLKEWSGGENRAEASGRADVPLTLRCVQKNFKNKAKRSFRINKTLEKWDETKPILGEELARHPRVQPC